jgi:lysophospholipase L1-like esterase
MLARITIAYAILFLATVATRADELLPLKDNERILFIGNGYIENDQWHAHLETRLQRRYPKQTLSFRYMGWSGDTVRGSARTAGFQVPQGLARLEKESLALKPTVIVLAYGMNESFDGPDALADFLRDYDKLLKTIAPLKARLVILSPTYHEDLGRPFPDPTEHNQHLQQYTKALKAFAEERKLAFVDLFHPLESAKKADPKVRLTTNGLLLTQAGYAVTGMAIELQLGFAPNRWEVTLDRNGKWTEPIGTKFTTFKVAGASLQFRTRDTMLPLVAETHKLCITELLPGDYTLKIDGLEILHASAADWQRGIQVSKGPMFDDAEKMRAAIVERNQLFYRRWRPYNDHSRHWGFIGGDFKLYDKDIADQEQRIAELRNPRTRTYEIAPKK